MHSWKSVKKCLIILFTFTFEIETHVQEQNFEDFCMAVCWAPFLFFKIAKIYCVTRNYVFVYVFPIQLESFYIAEQFSNPIKKLFYD